jgi:hypothetical protein
MRITKTAERWFDVPRDPDKARIKIKHLLPGEVADIFDEVFEQNINYQKDKKGKFEPVFSQTTDKKKDREMTLTMSIVAWENMFDEDDKPLECNFENIMRASRTIEGFNELITELREKLAKDIDSERKAQIKNLKGSASQ